MQELDELKDRVYNAKKAYRDRIEEDPEVQEATLALGNLLWDLFEQGGSVTTIAALYGTKDRTTITNLMKRAGHNPPRYAHKKGATGRVVEALTGDLESYWASVVSHAEREETTGLVTISVKNAPVWVWAENNPAKKKDLWTGRTTWDREGYMVTSSETPSPLHGELVAMNPAVRSLFV